MELFQIKDYVNQILNIYVNQLLMVKRNVLNVKYLKQLMSFQKTEIRQMEFQNFVKNVILIMILLKMVIKEKV